MMNIVANQFAKIALRKTKKPVGKNITAILFKIFYFLRIFRDIYGESFALNFIKYLQWIDQNV